MTCASRSAQTCAILDRNFLRNGGLFRKLATLPLTNLEFIGTYSVVNQTQNDMGPGPVFSWVAAQEVVAVEDRRGEVGVEGWRGVSCFGRKERDVLQGEDGRSSVAEESCPWRISSSSTGLLNRGK